MIFRKTHTRKHTNWTAVVMGQSIYWSWHYNCSCDTNCVISRTWYQVPGISLVARVLQEAWYARCKDEFRRNSRSSWSPDFLRSISKFVRPNTKNILVFASFPSPSGLNVHYSVLAAGRYGHGHRTEQRKAQTKNASMFLERTYSNIRSLTGSIYALTGSSPPNVWTPHTG